ncbi:MAG: hypothetical protein BEN19_04100 [Epulopiscium sp. Nuni2H_MBin003]|nr:MAG: hypothetical protein BEN19_04100 [Epulopiscium sp. Nuni2H_MBin003]
MSKIDVFLESLGKQIYDKDIKKRVQQEFQNHILDSMKEDNIDKILEEIGDPVQIGQQFNRLYARKVNKIPIIMLPIAIYSIGLEVSYYRGLDIVSIILMLIFLCPVYKLLEKKPNPCVGTLNRWGNTFFIAGIIGTIGGLIHFYSIAKYYPDIAPYILKLQFFPLLYGIGCNIILMCIDIMKYKQFNKKRGT